MELWWILNLFPLTALFWYVSTGPLYENTSSTVPEWSVLISLVNIS